MTLGSYSPSSSNFITSSTVRIDGTVRKERKVKPGYHPQGEKPVYVPPMLRERKVEPGYHAQGEKPVYAPPMWKATKENIIKDKGEKVNRMDGAAVINYRYKLINESYELVIDNGEEGLWSLHNE